MYHDKSTWIIPPMGNCDALLAAINAELAKRNLSIPKLGRIYDNEIEIEGVVTFCDRQDGSTDVEFGVKFPTRPETSYGRLTERLNADGPVIEGPVVVVVVNGQFAIVKRWSTVHGRWTYGFPRGHVSKKEGLQVLVGSTSRLSDILEYRLSGNPGGDAEVVMTSVAHLGNVEGITGGVYLIQYSLPSLPTDSPWVDKPLRVEFWEPGQVREELAARLNDAPTIAAYALAIKYFRQHAVLAG